MTVRIADESFRSVVGETVPLDRLASGFWFTEGPVWHPRERHLSFTDIPASRIHRWTEAGGVTVIREPSNEANGLTYDRRGRLLACEHLTSRVTRTEADGRLTVVASHYQGAELNSPNDIVVAADGAVLFTDPNYGRIDEFGVGNPRPRSLPFCGVYRVVEGGEPELLVDDFEAPNGLCFSPSGERLYVNDSERDHIRVFTVGARGRLSGGAVWAAPEGDGPGSPDGMKVDRLGNLYCTGPGGVHVFAPDARLLGVVEVPEVVANLAFGGDDLRDLFMTATTSLYRARIATPGLPVF